MLAPELIHPASIFQIPSVGFCCDILMISGSSHDSVVVSAIISPAKWVSPSMELCLTLLVVVVLLSFNANIVVFAKVGLGWALGLFVLELEHGFFGWDSSLLNTVGGHENEDEVIIVASVSPAEWVGPAVELGFANGVVLVGLSEESGVIVEFAEVGSHFPF